MKKDNEALKEIGKGLIAFANLFTVLSIVNIYLQSENINVFMALLSVFTFVALYVAGYKIIKRSSL